MTKTVEFCINMFTIIVSASISVSVGMVIISSAIAESKKIFLKEGNNDEGQ